MQEDSNSMKNCLYLYYELRVCYGFISKYNTKHFENAKLLLNKDLFIY